MTRKKIEPIEIKYDIEKVDRSIALRAGINLPDNFDIAGIIAEFEITITEKPIYILWNNGKCVCSETGGTDVIAYLYKEGDTIKGWSQ